MAVEGKYRFSTGRARSTHSRDRADSAFLENLVDDYFCSARKVEVAQPAPVIRGSTRLLAHRHAVSVAESDAMQPAQPESGPVYRVGDAAPQTLFTEADLRMIRVPQVDRKLPDSQVRLIAATVACDGGRTLGRVERKPAAAVRDSVSACRKTPRGAESPQVGRGRLADSWSRLCSAAAIGADEPSEFTMGGILQGFLFGAAVTVSVLVLLRIAF